MTIRREADGDTTVIVAERKAGNGYEAIRDFGQTDIEFPKSNRPLPEDASDLAKSWRMNATFAVWKGWVDAADVTMPGGVDRLYYFRGLDD